MCQWPLGEGGLERRDGRFVVSRESWRLGIQNGTGGIIFFRALVVCG